MLDIRVHVDFGQKKFAFDLKASLFFCHIFFPLYFYTPPPPSHTILVQQPPPPHSSLAPTTATATAPTQNPTERKPFVAAYEIANNNFFNARVSPILACLKPLHCINPRTNSQHL
ncbi:hypothetical protein Patl1_14063 [Pistacia atlantica]|uniref:Uncharacterized protein n=1 Tax=Pistacia atlantica TaxID=434234 RepID=A0ACC1AXT5_9ROSI|nr:hypothetical protein Patl1_14063 [Pistacia atlantica]